MSKRGWFILGALLLAAAAFFLVYGLWPERQPPVAETGAPAGDPFAGIPHVERVYYDVRGRSAGEIRAALNAASPRDPHDGLQVDALSNWFVHWTWPNEAAGCDLNAAAVTFSGIVRMPRLADEADVPPDVRAQWHAYLTALAGHEAGHLRHAYDNAGTVLDAIRASDCADAQGDAQAAVAAIGAWDAAYDRSTRHGFTQGAHFP